MSAPSSSPSAIGARAADVAVGILWRQWAVIGPALQSREGEWGACAIDPEALVLASAVLRSRERRLADLLGWFAGAGSTLVSVQRARTLASLHPPLAPGLGTFAHWAWELGSDARWKSLATPPDGSSPRPGKGPERPRLESPVAFWLRLRAAFGVGAKADILAHLAGEGSGPATAQELSEATGYTTKTVRQSVGDLELAGIVESIGDRPAKHRLRPGADRGLLALLYARAPDRPPRWLPMPSILAVLIAVAEWEAAGDGADDRYLASSGARDLVERYGEPLSLAGFPVPDPRPYRGEAFLMPFGEFVEEVARRMSE